MKKKVNLNINIILQLTKFLLGLFVLSLIVLYSKAYAITGYIDFLTRTPNEDEYGNRLTPPLSSTVVVNIKTSEVATNVSIAVWSNNNGQDDLAWYWDNNSGTNHYIQFDLASHGSPGEHFSIHAYANNNETWLDGNNNFYWDVTPPTISSHISETRYTSNPSQSFTVSGIRDETNYVDKIYFPTWKGYGSEGSNAYWYSGTISSSNNVYTGTFSINLTNVEDGKEGVYSVHCYPEDGSENRDGVADFTIYYDKTSPSITVSNISYGSNLTATISDSLSTLEGYAITTSTTAPSSWTSTSGSSKSLNFGKKDAGTYYVWAKDKAGNTNYKSVTVSKVNGSGSVTMADWTYGGTASNPSPSSSTNGTSNVTYSYSGRGSTSYGPTATKPSNAGTYTVTATFAASTNYNACIASANFTINKRQCTTPSISGWSGAYDGSTHYITTNSEGIYGTLQYKVGSGGTWTNGNPNTQSRTNAGTTTVYARRLGDSNNITSSETSADIAISRAGIARPTIADKTYNGSNQSITAGTGYSYTAGTTTAKTVGTYTATATPDGNHQWSTGSDVTSGTTVTWKIVKRNITITANNQTTNYPTRITKTAAQVTGNNLCSGHSITGITLTETPSTTGYPTPNANGVGTGTITPSGATITSSSDGNVTSNYNIRYANGTWTLKDNTRPQGYLRANNPTAILIDGRMAYNIRNISLTMKATDDYAGVKEVYLFNENSIPSSVASISTWKNWATSSDLSFAGTDLKVINWTLSNGDGAKTVYLYIRDKAGNVSVTF